MGDIEHDSYKVPGESILVVWTFVSHCIAAKNLEAYYFPVVILQSIGIKEDVVQLLLNTSYVVAVHILVVHISYRHLISTF